MGTSVAEARSSALFPSLQRTYRSPVTQTFATTSIIIVLGLISGIQIARALGPQGRGQVAAALLWPGLLVYFGSLGLTQAVVIFAAKANDGQDVSTVFSTAACLGAGLSGIALSLGNLFLSALLTSQSADAVRASRWFLLSVPPGMLSGLAAATLQGRCNFSKFNVLRFIMPLGYVLGLAFLNAAHQLHVASVVALQLALGYLTCLCSWLVLARKGIRFSLRSFKMTVARRLLNFGLKAYVGTLSGTLNQRLDQILLAAWFPAAQLGLYSVAVSAAGTPDTISFAFRTVASGKIARKSSIAEKQIELTRTLRRFCPILLAGAAGMALALPKLVPLIYGSAFTAAIPAAEVLLGAQVFYAGKTLLTSAAEAFGDSWLGSNAELVGLIPTMLLLAFFLPRWGILGAAFASVATCLIQVGVMLLGFVQKSRVVLSTEKAS